MVKYSRILAGPLLRNSGTFFPQEPVDLENFRHIFSQAGAIVNTGTQFFDLHKPHELVFQWNMNDTQLQPEWEISNPCWHCQQKNDVHLQPTVWCGGFQHQPGDWNQGFLLELPPFLAIAECPGPVQFSKADFEQYGFLFHDVGLLWLGFERQFHPITKFN